MSATSSLSAALARTKLEPGRTYRCRIGKLRVEVRVEEDAPDLLPAPLDRSDLRLDPWTDLPAPRPLAFVEAVPASVVLPDAPIIPDEEERHDLPPAHA